MNLGQIRTAIKDTLAGLNISVYDAIPQSLNPPCAAIYPDDIEDYGTDFSGGFTINMIVWCFVPAVMFEGAQDTLDDWLSDTTDHSIPAAIEDDPTLGGVVSSCAVTRVTDYGFTTLEETGQFLQAKIHLEIFT